MIKENRDTTSASKLVATAWIEVMIKENAR